MPGIVGQYVRTFKEANMAVVDGVSMNADYPHFFFDVIGQDFIVCQSNGPKAR